MRELLRQRHTPGAVVLGSVDAILTLGVIVAREMGYPSIPVVASGRRCDAASGRCGYSCRGRPDTREK